MRKAVSFAGRRFAVAALAAAVATAGFMMAGVASAYAVNVKTSVANGSSYAKAVAAGKTAGSAKASAKAMKGIKVTLSGVKGTVNYKLSGAKKAVKGKNGKAAAPGAAAQTLSVSLSGAAKKKYNVYYRTYTPGYGWLGWAKNGDAAGTKVKGKCISAVQVKLLAKNKTMKAYKATEDGACISAKGYYNGLTGDIATDHEVADLAKGKTLLEAFDEFNDMMDYYAYPNRATLGYKFPAKRFITEAKTAFAKEKGDCYTYTAGFTCVARFLGYKATPVAGKLKNKYGIYNASSWCLVKNTDEDTGEVRFEIWNPELQDSVIGDKDSVFVDQTKLVLDENGKPVMDGGDYVYEKDADGNVKQYSICIRAYGFTKAEIRDYNKTFEDKVFTGYGYATSAAEEI